MKDWRELLVDLEKMQAMTGRDWLSSKLLRDRQPYGSKEGRR
jgi:hypothetical protein